MTGPASSSAEGGHELHRLPVQVDVREGSAGGLTKMAAASPSAPTRESRDAAPLWAEDKERRGGRSEERGGRYDSVVFICELAFEEAQRRV